MRPEQSCNNAYFDCEIVGNRSQEAKIMQNSKQRIRLLSVTLVFVLATISGCASTTQAPGIFTVFLLPDTQNYAEKFPDTYTAQTEWIRSRVKADNVSFVIHLGDIVQNASVVKEWDNADQAHRVLDGVVPYSVAPGNHDMDVVDGGLTRGTSLYDKYFGPSRFRGRAWYGGHMGQSNANNYCFFESGGLKFMVLSLEYAPTDSTLTWASDVLAAHGDRRVIVETHYYMRTDGRGKGTSLGGYIGDDLWEKFIRKHGNIFMVVSGHVGGVYHQTSTNDAGLPVHEILCDYQGLPNGGDGWLQSLRFVPAENAIYIEAYSPVLDKHNLAPAHTYRLDYRMREGANNPGQG